MNQLYRQAQSTRKMPANDSPYPPRVNEITATEPTLFNRAQELGGYLAQIRDSQGSMRGILFGEREDESRPASEPSSLEGLLAHLCQSAACLAGEAKTILSRL